MKQKNQLSNVIPLIIIEIMSFGSFLFLLINGYTVPFSLFIGLILLTLDLFIYYIFNKSIFKWFNYFVIITGLTGIVEFTLFNLSFGNIYFDLPLIPFVLLIIYFIKFDIVLLKKNNDKKKQDSMVKFFEVKFKNLSSNEIKQKLEDRNKLTKEAQIALKKLLEIKNKSVL